jgi:hypothetical protein
LDGVLAYFDAMLAKFGMARIEHVSQIKHQALSRVICIETTGGTRWSVLNESCGQDRVVKALQLREQNPKLQGVDAMLTVVPAAIAKRRCARQCWAAFPLLYV